MKTENKKPKEKAIPFNYNTKRIMIETIPYLMQDNTNIPIRVGERRKLTVMTVWFLNECWKSKMKIDEYVHELERL